MELALKPHRRASGTAAAEVEVSIARHGTILSLDFTVRGDIVRVQIPDIAEPAFRDGLWQHTCFEAFVRPSGSETYVEINISPSNEWAVYSFDRYREGMQSRHDIPDPEIDGLSDEMILELWADVDLGQVSGFDGDRSWHVGLSAVVEETGGLKSYWALEHPPGKPDFHHPDCFALEVPAAQPA